MKLSDADRNNLTAAFIAGESVLSLARRYGLSRTTVVKYLKLAGLATRSQGDASHLAHAQRPLASRQDSAAHARQHMSRSDAAYSNLAASRARSGHISMSPDEDIFAAWLDERRVQYTRQVAVGRF